MIPTCLAAIHLSAQNGHWEVAQLLLQARADKDAATKNMQNSLVSSWPRVATQLCARQVGQGTQELVGAGAQKDAAAQDGRTALHGAGQNCHLEALYLLCVSLNCCTQELRQEWPKKNPNDVNMARRQEWHPNGADILEHRYTLGLSYL